MKKRDRDNGDSSRDRISKLPQPILHHILCFLDQKKAVTTCVLSKSWRHLWCTRPKIDFREGYTLRPGNRGDFLSVVDRTLRGYHDQNLCLKEFKLRVLASDGETALLLNKWIPILMHKSVGLKKLRLNFCSSEKFVLPSMLFQSDSIQNLNLVGCEVKSTTAVSMHYLQKLSFTAVCIPEEVLDDVLSNCPFIECVFLSCCTGFKRIKLLSNKPTNLKQFCFDGNGDTGVSIDIQTPLRIIKYNRDSLFSVDQGQGLEFAHLTRLSLTRVTLSSDLLSCSLPCLEEFTLVKCRGIKEFKLSSRTILKLLDIYNLNEPFKATIEAPSIVSFLYDGILPQSFSFATTSDHDDWKSKINFMTFPYQRPHCFNELHGLLKSVSQSEISLELDLREIQWLLSQQLHTEDTPLVVEHLTIKDSWEKSEYSSPADFLSRLFHMFRPSFIYMDRLIFSNDNLHPAAELLLKDSKMAKCYFWQRDLGGVSLQVFRGSRGEWRTVESTSLPMFTRDIKYRLGLKWRELS